MDLLPPRIEKRDAEDVSRLPSKMLRAGRDECPKVEPQAAVVARGLYSMGCKSEFRERHAPSEDGGLVARHDQPFAQGRQLLEHPLPMLVEFDPQRMPVIAIAEIYELNARSQWAARLRRQVKRLIFPRPAESRAKCALCVLSTGFFRCGRDFAEVTIKAPTHGWILARDRRCRFPAIAILWRCFAPAAGLSPLGQTFSAER